MNRWLVSISVMLLGAIRLMFGQEQLDRDLLERQVHRQVDLRGTPHHLAGRVGPVGEHPRRELDRREHPGRNGFRGFDGDDHHRGDGGEVEPAQDRCPAHGGARLDRTAKESAQGALEPRGHNAVAGPHGGRRPGSGQGQHETRVAGQQSDRLGSLVALLDARLGRLVASVAEQPPGERHERGQDHQPQDETDGEREQERRAGRAARCRRR